MGTHLFGSPCIYKLIIGVAISKYREVPLENFHFLLFQTFLTCLVTFHKVLSFQSKFYQIFKMLVLVTLQKNAH